MIHPLIRVALLAAILCTVSGCQAIGWVAHGLTPEKKPEEVKPEYQGLIGKSVAVMVATDGHTIHPHAAGRICQYVSNRLAVDVRDIRVVDPREIAAFTRKNHDWIAIPHGDLVREMKVDRIVYISVAQYTMHEPGNKELWQGTLIARVGVIEADAADPHKFAYVSNQQTQFPPDQPMGMLKGNEEIIQEGMLRQFADRLGAIFREEKPK